MSCCGNTNYGNANVASYLPLYGGNILANAITGTLTVGTQPAITTVGQLTGVSTTGNIIGNGNIQVTANITSTNGSLNLPQGNIYLNGEVVANGEIYSESNIVSNANVQADNGVFLSVYTGNIYTDGYFYANGAPFAGGGGGNGNVNYSNANVAAYLLTNTGNIAAGNISATGNIAGNYFLGNGALLTGITTNYSNANVAAYLPTYSGNLQAAQVSTVGNVGNISGANYVIANAFLGSGANLDLTNLNGHVIPGTNSVFTLGNITNQWKELWVSGNTIYMGNIPLSTDGNTLQVANSNVLNSSDLLQTGNLFLSGNIGANNIVANSFSISGQPFTIYNDANVATFLASGNLTSNVVTTANISGQYILGNGYYLTGISGGGASTYGNANVAAYLANSNVVISTTGNITANTFAGSGSGLTNLVPTPTAGDIVTTDANGNVVDSGKFFNDTTATNASIWSGGQTSSYVLQQLLNIPSLPPVNIATTANVTKSGLTAIDGVTPTATSYVLVKNQTNNDNGVYLAQAGAWIRQIYDGNAYANVTTETSYNQLGTNNGIVNVLAGTTNKNLQFQITPANPNATFGNTTVYVTATTKLPIASLFNRFVDASAGNDTTNNGSSAFPFATILKALQGPPLMSFPATITVAASGVSETSAIGWVSAFNNCTVQSMTNSHDAGQTTLTGVQTFGTGTTRIDFSGTTHSTGANVPFVFSAGALARNYFQSLNINTTATTWMTLPTNLANFMTLDQINNVNSTPITLPAFTNAFTFNIVNQIANMPFNGTGAANTLINIYPTCLEGSVRVAPGYLGSINWQGVEFTNKIGSTAFPSGVITNDTDLTTITGWTADSTYDGTYWIRGFTPANTNYRANCLISKQTGSGITQIWYARLNGQLPNSLTTIGGDVVVTGTSSAYGNVTANYVVGNISQATGLGNISTINLNGNANAVLAGDGTWVAQTGGGSSYGNANVAAYLPTYTGNLSPGNLITSNVLGDSANPLTLTANNSSTGDIHLNAGNVRFGKNNQDANISTRGTANMTISTNEGGATEGNIVLAHGANSNININPNGTGIVNISTQLSVQGNVSGNYILGNGALLTGLPATYGNANVAAYLPIYTGNISATNVNVANTVTANLFVGNFQGNITGNLVVPGANTQVIYNNNGNAGADIGFTYNAATKNVTVGNTVTANFFVGDGSQLTGLPAAYGNANVEAYLPTSNTIIAINANVANTDANVANNTSNITTLQGQVYTNSNAVTLLSSFGSNTISTTGNISAGYFIGDGSLLTGLPASYGNANVEAYLPTSNTIIAINANVANTDSNVANLTISLGNTNTNVSGLLTNVSILQGQVYANANVANYLPTYTGNISSGNIITTALSATGNITANYFVGDGSLLTNVASSYGNANVATYLPTNTGNVGAGNVNVTANGRITNQNITIVGNTISSVDTTMYLDPAGGSGALSGNVIIQGNLQVNGTTTTVDSNVITINDKAINLANNAPNASAANGGGIEIGPLGAPYITWLYNNTNNVWTSSANISAVGNIQGSFIKGNGSQLTGMYSNTNVQSYLPTYTGNVGGTLTTASQPYITNIGTLADLSVTGNTTLNNLVVTGNVSLPANITQISGNSGSFYGDGYGFGALYAGIASGYANLPATVLQVSANYPDYAQVNFQNINSGSGASADYVATADNGTNTSYYVDLGIASSTYDGLSANALGTSVKANDAYLYTFGNTGNAIGGNLILGAGTVGKQVKVIAGGGDTANVVATFANTGVSVTGNITGSYLLGNGAFLSGIATGTPTQIANGTSNVAIASSGGNITMSAGANSVFNLGLSGIAIGLGAGANAQSANAIAIGYQAGNSAQGIYSIGIGYQATSNSSSGIGIGYQAGQTSQVAGAIAIGNYAGSNAQAGFAIAMGYGAANVSQSANTVAIGYNAGRTTQGVNSIAIGRLAGNTNQAASAIAIGDGAGLTGQGIYGIGIGLSATSSNALGIGIGYQAGMTSQGAGAISLGNFSGSNTQAGFGLAIGYQAGQTTQGANAIAIGTTAGGTTQAGNAVAIGWGAGAITQTTGAIGIGVLAGQSTQGLQSIAIGSTAGRTTQGNLSIAIGGSAGYSAQGIQSIAIGNNAGYTNQGAGGIAVGTTAGQTTQGASAVAIGTGAGTTTQGTNSVAIGAGTGATSQGNTAVAIGWQAGSNAQSGNSIAIGYRSGYNTQGANAISIGYFAGFSGQGTNSIAIGQGAGGGTALAANAIVINASGANVSSSNSGLYVAPIRLAANTQGNGSMLTYNTSTNEVVAGIPVLPTFANIAALTTAVPTPAVGSLAYETGNNKAICWNGTSWNNLF